MKKKPLPVSLAHWLEEASSPVLEKANRRHDRQMRPAWMVPADPEILKRKEKTVRLLRVRVEDTEKRVGREKVWDLDKILALKNTEAAFQSELTRMVKELEVAKPQEVTGPGTAPQKNLKKSVDAKVSPA